MSISTVEARHKCATYQNASKAGVNGSTALCIKNEMLIKDVVHGQIVLPSYIEELVLHPFFQRLKGIQQLGFVSRVLQPQANHTRYEHCIGTYKSAQSQLAALERNSENRPPLPDWCRLAVEIAALLHDVGHGPFSHCWELVCQKKFNHEEKSLDCIDSMFADVESKTLLRLRDEHNGRGVQLIKALVLGCKEQLSFPLLEHTYIFDIVHNVRCGLDVDKWDYLRRDNHYIRLLSDEEMQFDDVFLEARISSDGCRIEYRYEDFHKIYLLFVARWRYHLAYYQFPKVVACEIHFIALVHRNIPHLLHISLMESNREDWLDLNDEHIMQLIAHDPEAVYLKFPERLVEVADSCQGTLRIQRAIPGPGKAMASDDDYACYGDVRQKQPIQRDLSTTIIDKWYALY